MRGFLAISLLAALLPSAVPAAEPDLLGYWLTENRKAIVETRECDGKICGHMVWLNDPLDEAGRAKLGADGTPLCGIQLLGDLRNGKPGRWSDGWILDPRSGDRYSLDVALLSPERLKVRGYLGFRALGSSQVWTRVLDNRGGC